MNTKTIIRIGRLLYGFSIVAVDPTSRNGRIIVEFHGFHNKATSSRMHIELTRHQSEPWYGYWTEQFQRIWDAAATQTRAGAF